jgi:diguanylate cyclase (GGDEF)-like protein
MQTKAYDMAAFMIMDSEGKINIQSSFGWRHDWIENYNLSPLNKSNTIIEDLINNKRMMIIEGTSKYPELNRILNTMYAKSVYIFPLIIKDKLFGILFITNNEVKAISEHQKQMITGIADQANIALHNLITLVSEIKKSSTDGLTGLYNRRYFDEQLISIVNEAFIKNTDVSLIMIDIDYFKKYNDTYGHPAGDYLLKKLAETTSSCVRSMDIIARYGGEEFVVILSNTNTSTAQSIAERIRRSVENMSDDKLNSKVTISLGVGTLHYNCEDPKSLIEFADKSLYHAKHTGKNRVCYGWGDNQE